MWPVAVLTMGVVGFMPVSAAVTYVPFLSVDFGSGTSPIESGFVRQSSSPTTHTTEAGNLTVTWSGIQGIFDYGSTTGANTALYRDFLFKNGGVITLTLSGPAIDASTTYKLQFWSYYGAEARNTSFAPASGTTGPTIGPISTSSASPTGLDDSRYMTNGVFTADGASNLTFAITGARSRPACNAFVISAAAPPAGTVLFLK